MAFKLEDLELDYVVLPSPPGSLRRDMLRRDMHSLFSCPAVAFRVGGITPFMEQVSASSMVSAESIKSHPFLMGKSETFRSYGRDQNKMRIC